MWRECRPGRLTPLWGGVVRLWWRQYFPSVAHYSHLGAILTSLFHYNTTRTT
ncbi:hypothetical protein E2C01_087028 [Portunus trituberculatus]|uniref:Uncharacterized protein n=1 Tax=Portunus trituberculatus TaxID=210409 RepID=A0A5B7J726_PORTR|nr:hypothetical protein [Portunus trituberculatus]